MTTEMPVMHDVLVALSALPRTLVWRHNTGAARTFDGRYITFGLVGSGDIIGCSDGVAVAVETKPLKGGVFSPGQLRFADAWRKAGGIYIPARSVEEALDGLRR